VCVVGFSRTLEYQDVIGDLSGSWPILAYLAARDVPYGMPSPSLPAHAASARWRVPHRARLLLHTLQRAAQARLPTTYHRAYLPATPAAPAFASPALAAPQHTVSPSDVRTWDGCDSLVLDVIPVIPKRTDAASPADTCLSPPRWLRVSLNHSVTAFCGPTSTWWRRRVFPFRARTRARRDGVAQLVGRHFLRLRTFLHLRFSLAMPACR